MACSYCTQFQQATSRSGKERFCVTAQRFVGSDKKSCSDIQPVKWFWCRRLDHWVDVDACLARNQRGEEGCVRCSQWREVLELKKITNRRNNGNGNGSAQVNPTVGNKPKPFVRNKPVTGNKPEARNNPTTGNKPKLFRRKK